MRLATYQSADGPRVAGVRGDRYVDLNRADPAVPACVKALLAQGDRGDPSGPRLPWPPASRSRSEEVRLLPAIPSPEKIDLHRPELRRPRRGNRRGTAARAGRVQQVPHGRGGHRRADRAAAVEPAKSITRPSWWW